jgi:hypothetical protein
MANRVSAEDHRDGTHPTGANVGPERAGIDHANGE